MPRGGYLGTVVVRNPQGARLFVAPLPSVNFSEARYDPDALLRYDSTGAIIRRRAWPPSNRTAASLLAGIRAAQELSRLRTVVSDLAQKFERRKGEGAPARETGQLERTLGAMRERLAARERAAKEAAPPLAVVAAAGGGGGGGTPGAAGIAGQGAQRPGEPPRADAGGQQQQHVKAPELPPRRRRLRR